MKKTLVGLLLICTCGLARALPFDIVYADGQPPLPTAIVPGQTITVFYTVTNNTGSTRSNNILHLPSNTTQVTGPGLCSDPISLNAGASCVLQLSITGPTDGCNPPLMLCFPGNLTCAGTEDVLQVESSTASSLRAVSGGQVSSPPILGLSNLVEVSLNNLDNWERQILGTPPSSTSYDSVCVGSGSTASCTLIGQTVIGTDGFINQTRDGGLTWANVIGITLTNNLIFGVDCTDSNFCVAAGYTNTPTPNAYIAISTATPGTWKDTGFTSVNKGNKTLNDAACAADGSICIAVGENHAGSGSSYIIQSFTPATAADWNEPSPPLDSSFTQKMITASCSDDGGICMAAGGSSSTSAPKILQTPDQGFNWYLAFSGTVILQDSSCTGSGSTAWCVTVGKDGNDPKIYYTTDSGATTPWAVNTPITGTPNTLLGVDCIGTITNGLCVAVGFGATGPLIFKSQNAGTWSQVNNISGLTTTTGVLYDVSCTGDLAPFTCVAVGLDNTDTHTLTITSFDSGDTWTVNNTSTVDGGILKTVSVTGG